MWGKGFELYFPLTGGQVNFRGSAVSRTGVSIVMLGGELDVGDRVFFNRGCGVNCMDRIAIGDNCMLGENVLIYDHDHAFGSHETLIEDQGYRTAPVTLGNNIWIGAHTVILKGVTIGDNCVVGAGSLVNKDIPANHLFINRRTPVFRSFESVEER